MPRGSPVFANPYRAASPQGNAAPHHAAPAHAAAPAPRRRRRRAPRAKRRYSAGDMAQLLEAHGAPHDYAVLLGKVAKRYESSGNPRARSGSNARGLFQICCSGGDELYDPDENADQAVGKLSGQGLRAWADFSSGPEKSFIQNYARRHNLSMEPLGASATPTGVKFADSIIPGPDPGDIIPGLPGAPDLGDLGGVAGALADLVNTIRDIADWFTSGEVWLTMLKIWGGLFLIALGLRGAYHAATTTR